MDGLSINHHHTQRLRRLAVIGLLAAALMTTDAYAEVFPRDRVLLPFEPAAATEGPAALRHNPAGLSIDPGFGLNFYHTYSDSSTNGDDGLFMSFKGFGLSTEWLGSGGIPDGRAHTAALSTGNDRIQIGSSYQWRSSDDPIQDKSHFWTHGVMLRPNDRLSLAAVADNYNRMKVNGARTDAVYVYSAALRLLDDALTIGGDWYQTTGQRWRDGTYRLAASMEVADGFTVFGDINENEDFFLGGRVDMTNLFIGSHSSFLKHGGYRGGVAYVGMTKDRRPPVIRKPREVVQLRLQGEIPDRQPPRRPFQQTPMTALDWLSVLDKAAADPMVAGIILTIDDPQIGLGRADELRRAIARVRAAGKPVVAFCDGMISNREYYIATAADRIVVPPVSTVDLLGLRAEVTFYKRLLDKIGVQADLEHIGNYKTASDLVTRTEMSDFHRESLNDLLDDFDDTWVRGIAAGRGVPDEQVRAWVEQGPFVSEDARAAGLVDNVAYGDELDGIMRAVLDVPFLTVNQDKFRDRSYHRSDWGPRPHVAVVFADGVIAEGTDRNDGLLGQVIGGRTTAAAIRRARENGSVRAIVLRVNSGGGSVFASDEIWREVSRTVGVKPIVVSFGDIAASGGYYIACGADSIFSLPATVTGSIGVISGKIVLDSLYEKIGVDKEVVTRGRYADLYGTTRPFNDDERGVVRGQIERAYAHFVGIVAAGRDLTADSIDAVAQGRVWSGARAERLGLVDRDADLWEVIQVAARMGGVERGDPVELDVLPDPGWELFQMDWFAGFPGTVGRGTPVEGLVSLLQFAGLVNRGPVFATPYTVTVQ